MLITPLNHFNEDVTRATRLREHAGTLLADETLRSDVLRAAWMAAAGACDAYFCDAYADTISRVLRAKDLEPGIDLPDRLMGLKVPVVAIIRKAKGGWRWRMAARELIEKESVLSLEKVRDLFNLFFDDGHKILTGDTVEDWILHPKAQTRCGYSATKYRKSSPKAKISARKEALRKLEARFRVVFQRRHDCIHNCDRPKVALQSITDAQVRKTIEDVGFLVARVNEALRNRLPVYLKDLGFSAATVNQVLQ